jgi:hypothetical protein
MGGVTSDIETAEQLQTLITNEGLSSPSLSTLIDKSRNWSGEYDNSAPNAYVHNWILEDLHTGNEVYPYGMWTLRKVVGEIVRLHNHPDATLGIDRDIYEPFRLAIIHFREQGKIGVHLYELAREILQRKAGKTLP